MFRPMRTHQIVFDVLLAAVFGLLFIPIELVYSPLEQGAGHAGVVLAVLVLIAALLMRRLSPGLALGLAWLGAIVQMVSLLGPRPVDIAIFAVLYATAAYGSRLVYWLGFASAIFGAVVMTLYLFLVLNAIAIDTMESIITAGAVLVAALFALLLSWVSGALVRMALRAQQNRRAQEIAEATAVAEQERVRIARDMHDVVAHSLAVVVAQADGARYAAAADPSAATTALATISTTARSALADVRLLLTQLRHSQGEGPQPTLADVEGLYAGVRAAGVDLRVEVDPVPAEEPAPAVQLAVYRILQEALTNALRHGADGPVDVRLSWRADAVAFDVRNRRDPAVAPASHGHGVIGMRERAQLVGGMLEARAEDEEFIVAGELPVRVTR